MRCYPLTKEQQQIYDLIRVKGDTAASIAARIDFTGTIEVSALKNAVSRMIESNEVLHARIVQEGIEVQQFFDIPTERLFAIQTFSSEAEIEGYANQVQGEILSIEGALCFVTGYQTDNHYGLIIHMHHIIGDGWTVMLLGKQFALYLQDTSCIVDNQPLVYRFSDHIMREQLGQKQRQYQKDMLYWRSVYDEISNPYLLAQNRRNLASEAKRLRCSLNQKDSERIVQICKACDTTPAAVFFTLFAAYFDRLRSEKEEALLIGVPFFNRKGEQEKQTAGTFVNTFAVRADIEEDKPFRYNVLKLSNTLFTSMRHLNCNYNAVLQQLDHGSKYRDRLYDISFNYLIQNAGEIEASVNWLFSGNLAESLAINVSDFNASGCFELFYDYQTDVFHEEDITRLHNRFLTILNSLSSLEDSPISEAAFLPEAEIETVLHQFNNTAVDYPRDKTVVDLFEEQVKKTPDQIAVISEEHELTYRELNGQANRVAMQLIECGVKPNDVVAIYMPRRKCLLPAILGALKAGATYLPIATNLPKERVRLIIQDSDSAVVLHDMDCEEIQAECRAKFIRLREIQPDFGKDVHVPVSPEDGSYIIYTSGSTGTPKGTILTQLSLLNYCKNNFDIINSMKASLEPRMLSTTTISFDMFITESLLSVCNGVMMVLATEEQQVSQDEIARLVREKRCTAIQATPSKMKLYMEDATNCDYLREIKTIILGGEVFTGSLYTELRKHTNADLFNIYGPSETNVITIEQVSSEKVTIGKPYTNTQIYILDHDQVCGIGVPGELYAAGDCVGKGYLNRPELTAEKFIDNPYGEGKLYRSGDLARWLPDGNIEYLGRIDEQVKIRGFRIELGEIESSIRAIENVKDCAVIARNDQNGEKAIYAYIVSDEEISVSEIRDTLGLTLPEYMIPAYMTQIEKIPVTRNGKLDKRALPEIEGKSEREYVAPRNPEEEAVCAAFENVLGVEKVGIKDNFFELGGHSLRATRLINQIEEKTGTRLELREVFSHPTPEGLAACLTGGETYIPIPAAEKRSSYPMSSTQKRTYLVTQMDQAGLSYNMPTAIKLTGEMDVEKVRQCFQALIDRHEALRTSFGMENGELVQRIAEAVQGAIEYEEQDHADEATIQKGFADFVRPFDLSAAPLMRIKIVKTAEAEQYVFFDMHHIISDGMSMNLVIEEFSKLYNGETLEALRVQYKDYSEWMRGRDLSKQAAYWKEQFAEEVPVLDMPTDYPRPQVQSYRGDSEWFQLSAEETKKIEALCKQTGATEYMVFLSALMITLSKYSRQEDIVIGSPISGRTHRDTETMLGMFVNTLAMRGRPEGKKTVGQFLTEIKDTCLKAYENQEYPFEELVEEVAVHRDLSRNPLFDVMLVLQNNEDVPLKLKGLEITGGVPTENVAKFDLDINVSKAGETHIVMTRYCTDLFKAETIQWLNKHFREAIRRMSETPDAKIADISLLEEAEYEEVIHKFNETATEYSRNKTVIDLFEEQVRKTPDNVAVVFEDTQLTYRELNARANQLARKLRKLGVKPDDFVAMLTERSLEMIIGIYGILKAGGAYVPMDPTYPEERIRYMLEDCKPKAILTYHAEIETDIPVIDLRDRELWTGDSRNLPHVSKADNLAYCIYTSGTTGKPKGVLVKQENVVNYVQRTERSVMAYAYAEKLERLVSVTNMSFDIFGTEAILPLCHGMSVYIANREEQVELRPFEELVKKHRIEVLQTTPSRIKALLAQNGETEAFANLKYIMLGGEAVGSDIVKKLQQRTKAVIENVYGPSETTVWSTCFRIDGEYASIPIGKPIQNTQVFICDGDKLCGIGMPGELCIAGDGVARGYLNRPELTAEKFIDNPFGEGKLYRSGDLARWLPDGNIEYLGRIDEQVKIRGYRIELGEIESSLRNLEGIKDCAVIARADENGEKAIYAYLVSDDEINVSEIRDTLLKILPEYMIPAYMAQIEKIPVTRNGKLDKRALPEIAGRSEREYVAPRNPEEEAVCEAFSTILSIEKVGIKDDFFELGGDSIKAIRVVSILREKHYQATVRDIMQNMTVERIAGQLKQEQYQYEQGEINGEVPLTPIQRAYFEEWKNERPELFTQMVQFTAKEHIPEEALHAILHKLTEHHDILRAVYHNGKQIILPVKESKLYTLVKKELTSEEELEEEGKLLQSGINLEEGPLFKIGIFYIGEKSNVILVIHRLVVDKFSWWIILEDIKTGYRQWKEGKEIQLPPKTASYKEWSELVNEYSGRREAQKELSYWQKTEAESQGLEINGETAETGIGIADLTLSEDITQAMQRKMKDVFLRWKDIILTSLARTISDWTGQDGITVFLEGQGRENLHRPIMTDRTVGCFTSIYPVNLRNKRDIETTLIETKETLRKIPNHGIGYGILRSIGESDLKGIPEEIVIGQKDNLYAKQDDRDEIQVNKKEPDRILVSENTQRTAIFIGWNVWKQLTIQISYNKRRISDEQIYKMRRQFEFELTKFAELLEKQLELDVFKEQRKIFEAAIDTYDKSLQKNASLIAKETAKITQYGFIMHEKEWLFVNTFDIYNHTYQEIRRALWSVIEEQPVLRMAYDEASSEFVEYSVKQEDFSIALLNEDMSEYIDSFDYRRESYYRNHFVGEKRMLAKCFLIANLNGSFSVYLFAHHSIWDMESESIFEKRVNYYLDNSNQSARPMIVQDQRTSILSVELKEYLQSYLSQVQNLHPNDNVEVCNFIYYFKDYQLPKEKTPVEMIMACLYHTVKCHDMEQSELPFLMYYHARNSSNKTALGLYLDYLPVILRLAENSDSAAEMLENDMDYLIKKEYSSCCLPELMPRSLLIKSTDNVPHFNIRMHEYTNDVFEVKEEDIPVSLLFTTHSDVFKNGTVFRCVIEKQKVKKVRQTLDQLFLRDGQQF